MTEHEARAASYGFIFTSAWATQDGKPLISAGLFAIAMFFWFSAQAKAPAKREEAP